MLTKKTLLIVLGLATLLKLWISASTFGTNDVKYWGWFMHYVGTRDILSIYQEVEFYNHPPVMSVYLIILHKLLGDNSSWFPFVLRLPAIISDVITTLLVYTLAQRFFSEKRAVASALVVALSPVLIQISGFHGNTDPVFTCIVLLAAYTLLVTKRAITAGFLFGCAFSIKVVPLICIPYFFFMNPTWRSRVTFFGATFIALVCGFAYNIAHDAQGLLRNVFLYKSHLQVWGISELFPTVPLAVMDRGLKLAIVTGLSALAGWGWLRRRYVTDERERLLIAFQTLGLTYLTFLVFTPGFGVQYLSWLVASTVFLNLGGAIGFNILGGAFLFSVYTFWNRGFPWYNADSDFVGMWTGLPATLDLALWCYLAVWLLYEITSSVQKAVSLKPQTSMGNKQELSSETA